MGNAPESTREPTPTQTQPNNDTTRRSWPQECLHIQDGAEVVFLEKRLGFVKLAIQSGSPLVPAFTFGQSRMCASLRFASLPFASRGRSCRVGFICLRWWCLCVDFWDGHCCLLRPCRACLLLQLSLRPLRTAPSSCKSFKRCGNCLFCSLSCLQMALLQSAQGGASGCVRDRRHRAVVLLGPLGAQ